MNEDGMSAMLQDNTVIQQQLATILTLLQKKRDQDNSFKPEDMKALQDSLFPEQKNDKSLFRRLKQKQKSLQGVPVSLDSISADGKRDLRKTFSNIFSFKLDTKKPDEKSGPWAKLFFIIAFIVGFLVGAVQQVFKDLKFVFNLIKGKLSGFVKLLEETKIGQAIRSLLKGVKLKFLNALKYLKNTSIVKSISGFIKDLKVALSSKFKAIVEFTKKALGPIGKGIQTIFSSVRSVFTKIGKFFKPITSFLSKFKVLGKVASGPGKLIKGFMGFFGKISKFFKLGMKVGRVFGRLLGPLFFVIEIFSGLYKAFTDTKLADKSFTQKLITGFVAGIGGFFDIFSIFGLEFFNFDEIRDRIEKIFKPFREGKWVQGLGQIVNQIVSWVIAIPNKILGWIVSFFNKDLGKKITEEARNFDLFESIKNIVGTIMKWVKKFVEFFKNISDGVKNLYTKIKSFTTGLYDKIVNFVENLVDAIASIFNIGKIKDWIKEKLGFGDKGRENNEPLISKPVGDYASSANRTMVTGRSAVSFDKNDEILAMKKDGPISNILQRTYTETSTSINNLTTSVKQINDIFSKFVKAATTMQQNELKLMTENISLLRDIKDKRNESNVVVQNNSNSNIFSEKVSSNLDFRRGMVAKGAF